MKAILILALVGATIGTLCDRMHVLGDVLSYREPVLDGQALWVPALFAVSAVALLLGHRLVVRLRGGSITPGNLFGLLRISALFYFAYLSTALFPTHPEVLLVCLLVGFVPLAFTRRHKGFVLYAIGTAIVGTGVESAISSTGAFRYHAFDMMGVPMWLPALYLYAAVWGAECDRYFEKPWSRDR